MKTIHAQSAASMQRDRRSLLDSFRQHKVLWIMLIPALVYFIVFCYTPMAGIWLAFTRFDFRLGFFGSPFVGLDNFQYLFKSGILWQLVRNTVLYNLAFLIIGNILQIVCAIFLSELMNKLFVKISQSVIFLPYFISMVVAAGMVVSFIEKDGLVNQIITLLGGDPVSFRTDPKWFPVVYTVTNIWKSFGWNSILYLSAMASIDPALYESARLDGANRWQTLWKVTIPNVMPSITICTFLTLTNSFKLFDQNLALTGGQPYIIQSDGSAIKTTEMLALNIYNTFYGQNVNSRGTAQAKAVLFFLLVAAIGLIQLRATRKKEVQQ